MLFHENIKVSFVFLWCDVSTFGLKGLWLLLVFVDAFLRRISSIEEFLFSLKDSICALGSLECIEHLYKASRCTKNTSMLVLVFFWFFFCWCLVYCVWSCVGVVSVMLWNSMERNWYHGIPRNRYRYGTAFENTVSIPYFLQ